jgi:ATP-dependent DNA ligase
MKADFSKMNKVNGYLEGGPECTDESLKDLPSEYKRRLARSFYAINTEDISKISGKRFFVSKKIDGHLQVVVFNGDQIFMIGRRGIVRAELPCLEAAKKVLTDKKIDSMVAGAELYAQRPGERSRVYDVRAALSDEKTTEQLGLAFFDMIEIGGQSLKTANYETVYGKLSEIFPKTGKAHLIETRIARSKADIKRFSQKWIEEEGEEGLVVRGDMPFVYKIKPKHTFDAAIVGYVEGINDYKGKVKTMLFAFMRESGIYQVAGKVGNNLTLEERKQFFEILSQKHTESSFIETDNDGVAFHMVYPEIVIEVGCNDIMIENTYGKPLLNPLIRFEDNRYSLYNRVAGVRFISPMVERIREDKTVNQEDIRFSQLTDLVYLPEESVTPETLPKSELMFREVYQKTLKDKLMVQKFLVWKTHKEKADPRYPAYVMHYTNFSPQRKEPLQRDIRISNSESQIMELTRQFIDENVKKGWVQYEG